MAKRKSETPELDEFERKVKAIRKALVEYASTGGDHYDSKANDKLEDKLRRRIDDLQEQQRRLGLWENEHVFEIRRLLREEFREARALADAERSAENQRQIKTLDDRIAERRLWRIENGLEDPPRRIL